MVAAQLRILDNGPAIERHAAFLALYYRNLLPDRPRPVIVEEFGILPGPQFPAEMRAEHARQFLEAGKRCGLAGLVHWDWEEETNPGLLAAYRQTSPYQTAIPEPGTIVAAYLPPSHDWNVFVYARYMVRRNWEAALAAAIAAGCEPKIISSAKEASAHVPC